MHPKLACEFSALSYYNDIMNYERDEQEKKLFRHPNLIDTFFPELNMIPINDFREEKPKTTLKTADAPPDYLNNVIFDPCRGHPYDCCEEAYGTPEYIANENETAQITLTSTGDPFDKEISRLQDQHVYVDDECTGRETPLEMTNFCFGCWENDLVLPLAECASRTFFLP